MGLTSSGGGGMVSATWICGQEDFVSSPGSLGITHTIHGTICIFPYIYHKRSTIHVGKYTIDGIGN